MPPLRPLACNARRVTLIGGNQSTTAGGWQEHYRNKRLPAAKIRLARVNQITAARDPRA
jgi:hypothetical protein